MPFKKCFLQVFSTCFILKRVTDNHGVQRVAIAILHYLRDHPLAKDSVKGIARWWVSEERELVEKAVALLVKEGVMEKQRHVYQLTQSQREQNGSNGIKKMLRRLQRRK